LCCHTAIIYFPVKITNNCVKSAPSIRWLCYHPTGTSINKIIA
jgi:hypothetical protein